MEDTRGVVRLGMPYDQRPNSKDLHRFLTDYCMDWRSIGLQLQLKTSVLDQVEADYHTQSERFRVTLEKWLQLNVAVTWAYLELAITNANRESLGLQPLMIIPTTQPAVMAIQSNRQDNHNRPEESIVDGDCICIDSSAAVNFADFENVADAFTALMRIFTEELHDAKFETIRTICLARADKKLRDKIGRTTSIGSFFELLACNPFYFNWMNVEYLQTMAIASGNTKLLTTLKCYTDIVFSKTLGEVWNFVPSFHKIKAKYYTKVRARFDGKDPDNIEVKDLKKYQPKFAEKIALRIMKIKRGSLMITWCILAEAAYQAYLLVLNTPQEFREDDFLQIGTWVAYKPQFVIQELKRVHTMMTTGTLVIGYYHGLLLKSIDADELTDKVCSPGLLTAHEQIVISSGHSVYQKNCLLLGYVRHMDLPAQVAFCELVQEICPQIGSQLIAALKEADISAPDESHIVYSKIKQDDVHIADDDIRSSVELLFLFLIEQVNKLLRTYKLELIQQCKSLKASNVHNINLFSPNKIKELNEYNNTLMTFHALFTWSNHSILKSLAGCSIEAVKLLDEFESKLDLCQPITSYPIPCLYANMIPSDTSTYTILAVRCDKELYQCSLQYVYDVQSVMIEKCDITQHCLQLLAVRSDPTIFYWTIPKCVVDLINTNVPLHSEYLYSRGIMEVLVYPDLLLTTGDDVCYGSLVFKSLHNNQFFSEEIDDVAIASQRKEYNVEAVLKHVHSQCDALKSELQHTNKYAKYLEDALKLKNQENAVTDQIQAQEQIMTITGNEQNDEEISEDELDKESILKLELGIKEEHIDELKKENQAMKIRVNQLNEEVDDINSEKQLLKLKNDKLKRENDLLVNKYGGSGNANKLSVEIGCQTEKDLADLVGEVEQMEIAEHVFISKPQQKKMITDTLEENGITVNYTDHRNLKYFTVRVEAFFRCENCNTMWSSHNAIIGVNLYGCRVDKNYRQRCKNCMNWVIPELTIDLFKEAIDSIVKKYWQRKGQDDDSDDTVIDDGDKGYSRKPHASYS